jgi:uncharacterized protein YifE (UPF0438 family)
MRAMSIDDPAVELTDEERDLLGRYLRFYKALARRQRTPKTEAQQHFVEVMAGRARAETIHEIAYIKHRRIHAQLATELAASGLE